jgi:nucleoside-diphosphate-sugar epimerase
MTVPKAAIAGGTGLIGKKLRYLLSIEKPKELVQILVRRKVTTFTNELMEVVDFSRLSEVESKGLEIGYCTLGTTIKKAGSRKKFREVDVGMVEAFAHWCKNNGAHTFVVISSIGAGSPGSNFYLRTKAEMENMVAKLGFDRVIILRPSLLLGKRSEFRLGEKLGEWLAVSLPFLFIGKMKKYKPVYDVQVARAMLDKISILPNGIHVIPSDDIASYPNY